MKNNNPYDINEVPVQTTTFDIDGMGSAHPTRKWVDKPTQKPKNTNRNMSPMSTGENIESWTENMGLPPVGGKSEFISWGIHEVSEFIYLTCQENGTKNNRSQKHPAGTA